ncbi:hypothetical protein RXV94_09420 [Yeosuana sp. MJ-SS3]|jgi:hypothetical protein|uniref:T9SS type A sorting domain-containing protein n=1 Tax=Gilvirhabdus luticola TaxID=3079858 RepID=A0ABU3U7S4_9FLAO|nr:hypothetical protein [Yeosuana sp. MJ-SS3]MDU8886377.1 hypothetical protein [Yeosuana sp. MJ-SS3]
MTKITQLAFAIILVFGISAFTTTSNAINNTSNNQATQSSTIQRVRIDFTTPTGYVRHLLLAFTTNNAASDGFDYGYDGMVADDFPDDLNWMIEDDRYVIQGVGAFDQTKKYPLGLFLTNSGNIEISLTSLENFSNTIDVFIYDTVLDTYTPINDLNFSKNISSGDYLDRFYIAFQDDNQSYENAALSIEESETRSTIVNYLRNTNMLYVNTNSSLTIKKIEVFSILGKQLFTQNNINTKSIKIPLEHINTNYGIVSVTTEKGILSKKVVLK